MTAREKIRRKKYDAPGDLGDIVRAGFVVETPAEAEAVIRTLGTRLATLDEGWQLKDSGYLDRKLMVRFGSGLVGEVQLWPPSMYQASKAGGHDAYRASRTLAADDPRRRPAETEQRALFSAAAAALPGGFKRVYDALAARRRGHGGMPSAASHLSASAGDNGLPSYQSSPDEISAQVSDRGRQTNALSSSSHTANRLSSVKNLGIGDTSKSNVGVAGVDGNLRVGDIAEARDMSHAAIPPDPAVIEAQAAAADAAAGLARPEAADDVGADLGVEPESGAFPEQVDLDQLRAEGRLTATDEAALREADTAADLERAAADALDAITTCAKG